MQIHTHLTKTVQASGRECASLPINTYTTTGGTNKLWHTHKHIHAHCLMPSQLPARLPSYYLSVGSERKMQMFVSLKIESVTAKLRAICKNRGTNSLKCLHGRERRVRARGLTDCSIRKPITVGWTNLPWCFNKSPAFLTLRTISLLPPDFVAGFCGIAVPLLLSVLQSCLAIWDEQTDTYYHWASYKAKPFINICILAKWGKQKEWTRVG